MASSPTVKFGTSGLRGKAEEFTPSLCHAYVGAFLRHLETRFNFSRVLIGADRRASSPQIARHIADAVRSRGLEAVFAGIVPTPALALAALEAAQPAIMVTGSHIPEIYNGLKFYRPDGELLKEDEAPIRGLAEADPSGPSGSEDLPPVDGSVLEAYIRRCLGGWGASALAGLRLGVDLHSAAGRDAMVAILQGLGADCHPYRRSDVFLAVDTEALDQAAVDLAARTIRDNALAAVVSTDGDGDRPLLIDETGRQVPGDVLGAVTARALGADTVVTPLTATTGLELSGWFRRVVRTAVGSPFVVAALRDASLDGIAVGFEANGGFLLGSNVQTEHGRLTALPTRDAMLPLIVTLAEVRRRGVTVGVLAAELPPRFMRAGRLPDVPGVASARLLAALESSALERTQLSERLGHPASVDSRDGVRLVLVGGDIVHFRASGNAPELRCYVETGSPEASDALLAGLLDALSRRVPHFGEAQHG